MMNGVRKTKKSRKKKTRSATGEKRVSSRRRTTTALSIFFRRFVLPYTTFTSRLFGAGYPNAAPTPTR
jgi:hypothetical protein